MSGDHRHSSPGLDGARRPYEQPTPEEVAKAWANGKEACAQAQAAHGANGAAPSVEVANVPPEPEPGPALDSATLARLRADGVEIVVDGDEPVPADLDLDPRDLDDLRRSGLTDDTIRAAGLRTERDATNIDRALGLAWSAGHRGRFVVDGELMRVHRAALRAVEFSFYLPGASEPYASRFKASPYQRPQTARDEVTGEYRVELDDAGKPSGIRYESPTATKLGPVAQLLYFGPKSRDLDALADTSRPLYVAEAEKKQLALEQCGYLTIGLTGIWNWSDASKRRANRADHPYGKRFFLHPHFAQYVALKGRRVVIVYDHHSHKTDPAEPVAAAAFAKLLYQHGASEVRFVVPPTPEHKGIDDYLAAHGEAAVHELIASAVLLERPTSRSKQRGLDEVEAMDDNDEQPPHPATAVEVDDANWQSQLSLTDKGRVKGSTSNIETILLRHDRWRDKLSYNERSDQVLVDPGSPLTPDAVGQRAYVDRDDSRVGTFLEREYGIDISPSSPKLRGAVALVAAQKTYDPVRDYLNGLVWDGQSRLDRMLVDYFSAEDTTLNRALGSMWMISAVARAYRPGCKVDHVTILEGEQGDLKSSTVHALAGGEPNYADGLPDLKNKDAADYVRGPWIIEFSELSTLERSDVGALKGFITRLSDRYRSSYAYRTQTHPRRCVFIGTTNDGAYLKDTTGNRRFWPVETGKCQLDAMRRDRDQLWAEARARYEAGEPWWITKTEHAKAVERVQEAKRNPHAWEPKILKHLELVEARRLSDPYTTLDEVFGSTVLNVEIGRVSRADSTTAGAILHRFGWRRADRPTDPTGERLYRYRPVEGWRAKL
jgi:predicted P-loop ATPase